MFTVLWIYYKLLGKDRVDYQATIVILDALWLVCIASFIYWVFN